MRISFSLRSLLMFIVLMTVFMFTTTAAMADKGSRLSGNSVVALKALDVGWGIFAQKIDPTEERGRIIEALLIAKGDGVFVATDGLAIGPDSRGKKVIYLTNTTIPATTKGDAIGHNIIVNSRPTWRLDFAYYRIGFPLRT